MKKLILVLLCTIATSFCLAQEIEWQNTIGGNQMDVPFSIVQTPDGGYIIGGNSRSGISGDKTENCLGSYDYWIVKIDSMGSIQWENTIGGNFDDNCSIVGCTVDGGYIIGGSSFSGISGDKTENSNGDYDFWIVKVDSAGSIQWQNTLGGNGSDWLASISQTTDGGYICGGRSMSGISGDKTEACLGNMDIWVIKLNSLGSIEWQNTIQGGGDDDLTSIFQTADGGYMCGAISNSIVSGDKTVASWGESDFWILKLDSAGDIEWQRDFGGTLDDKLFSILSSNDGGYICGGYSESDLSGNKAENSCGVEDFWVIKIDSIGQIQWQNTIGGTSFDEILTITKSDHGGYLLGGLTTSSLSGKKTEDWVNGAYWFDIWVVKIDSLGRVVWQNTIGGLYNDFLYSLISTNDGKYVGIGGSDSNIGADKSENCLGTTDYWVLKLTGDYNLIAGKTFIDLNSNLIQDANEPNLASNKIVEQTTGKFAFSQQNGSYNINLLDTGNFLVTPMQINYYNSVPLLQLANFNGINQIDSLNDFAFQPQGAFNDLGLSISALTQFRSGFNASYQISCTNHGTTLLIGAITLFKNSNWNYVSSSVSPIFNTIDSIVWTSGPLAPFQTSSIIITVNVIAGLPLWTIINSNCYVAPISNDANPINNFDTSAVTITGSYDPNDILVNEDTLTTTQLATAPFLDYIIRFQNTGNDTAFTVKVLNPIDTNKLELSTIEFINSSHPVNLNWINYQRNMEFKFDNILLPDSNTNEPASHGFVHYRIKPKTTLLAGDSVTNNAYIYFDFNSPVATNTAVTHIILPTSMAQEAVSRRQLVVYPNPAKDEITITGYMLSANKTATLKVFDVYGKEVLSQTISTASCLLPAKKLMQGVYFVQVQSAVKTARAKFVKQ